jgi:hypothetical protein
MEQLGKGRMLAAWSQAAFADMRVRRATTVRIGSMETAVLRRFFRQGNTGTLLASPAGDGRLQRGAVAKLRPTPCAARSPSAEYGGYPKTTVGHIVAGVLMIAGVALFGTFTATVASFFVQQDSRQEDEKIDAVLRKLDAISERMDQIEESRNCCQSAAPLPPAPRTGPSEGAH